MMRKTEIRVDPTKCTLCYCCQLRCSYVYSGAFNPEKARIVPNPPYDISFTDECRRGCSACAAYCPTGALMRIR